MRLTDDHWLDLYVTNTSKWNLVATSIHSIKVSIFVLRILLISESFVFKLYFLIISLSVIVSTNTYLYICLGDQCPMYFDDGSNPWVVTENTVKIFNFNISHGEPFYSYTVGILLLCMLITHLFIWSINELFIFENVKSLKSVQTEILHFHLF